MARRLIVVVRWLLAAVAILAVSDPLVAQVQPTLEHCTAERL